MDDDIDIDRADVRVDAYRVSGAVAGISTARTRRCASLAERRAKLDTLRESGGAYPNGFERSALAAALQEDCEALDKAASGEAARRVAVCGRLMLRRVMGRASFFTVEYPSGRIQCYVRRDDVGDATYKAFKKLWDLGDIVGKRSVGQILHFLQFDLFERRPFGELLGDRKRDPPTDRPQTAIKFG